jgi:hypothetical protein
MEEMCLEDGGEWKGMNNACQGLDKEWCDDILVELELGSVGWKENTASCFVY